jgi:hypothetical protein
MSTRAHHPTQALPTRLADEAAERAQANPEREKHRRERLRQEREFFRRVKEEEPSAPCSLEDVKFSTQQAPLAPLVGRRFTGIHRAVCHTVSVNPPKLSRKIEPVPKSLARLIVRSRPIRLHPEWVRPTPDPDGVVSLAQWYARRIHRPVWAKVEAYTHDLKVYQVTLSDRAVDGGVVTLCGLCGHPIEDDGKRRIRPRKYHPECAEAVHKAGNTGRKQNSRGDKTLTQIGDRDYLTGVIRRYSGTRADDALRVAVWEFKLLDRVARFRVVRELGRPVNATSPEDALARKTPKPKELILPGQLRANHPEDDTLTWTPFSDFRGLGSNDQPKKKPKPQKAPRGLHWSRTKRAGKGWRTRRDELAQRFVGTGGRLFKEGELIAVRGAPVARWIDDGTGEPNGGPGWTKERHRKWKSRRQETRQWAPQPPPRSEREWGELKPGQPAHPRSRTAFTHTGELLPPPKSGSAFDGGLRRCSDCGRTRLVHVLRGCPCKAEIPANRQFGDRQLWVDNQSLEPTPVKGVPDNVIDLLYLTDDQRDELMAEHARRLASIPPVLITTEDGVRLSDEAVASVYPTTRSDPMKLAA